MEVKWVKSMSVGEETIDGQHKNLLNQIDIIRQVISTSEINMGLLRESIHFLYLYIKNHLSYEEKYMQENNYPDFQKHKKIHENFIKFYDDFEKELRDKSRSKDFSSIDLKEFMIKIEKYLADWWINHIITIDQKYAKYIKTHSK